MEVKRVVVDELPRHCTECRFMEYKTDFSRNLTKEFCFVMDRYWDDNYILGRPDWCPLVVESEE